jgi:hypothetical protein
MRIAAAAIAVVLGSLSPTVALSQDANQEVAAGTNSMAAARKMLRQLGLTKLEAASLESAQARGDLCAFAQIQGPAGNFNIQPVISNFVTNEVDVVILDVFGAAGGASLLIDSVFSVTPPPGGSLDVEYPSGVPGEGPAVLSSTGWGFGESAFFNLDPDAYDDPGVRRDGRGYDRDADRGGLHRRSALCRRPGLQRGVSTRPSPSSLKPFRRRERGHGMKAETLAAAAKRTAAAAACHCASSKEDALAPVSRGYPQ